jgi:cytoskeletal protein CcmA (bactofilin family)
MPKIQLKEKGTPEEVILRSVARFGPSLFFKGELSGSEDVVIEGHFEGKIDLKNSNILVGETGKIKADIWANNITIKGSVEGNIQASNKVFISDNGQLKGDINAPTISIMDGARFRGSVKMGKEAKQISPSEKEMDLFASQSDTEAKQSETEGETEGEDSLKFHDV